MSIAETWRREKRVALSRKAQPVWFRVVKWIVFLGVGVLLWRTPYFWVVVFGAMVLGVGLHLFWRWKTRGWTRSWGGWKDVETANRE
jgi:hypothetical protein